MPDWLAEPDSALLLLVAVFAVGFATLAWRTRQRSWLILAGLALFLLFGLYLCDRFFQSDRELIGQSIQSIAAAVDSQNLDAVFSHISEEFQYSTVNKAGFRRFCKERMQANHVESLVVWNFQVLKFNETRTQADVSFQFKVKAGGRLGNLEAGFYLCKAEFVKEADGKWRMKTFKVYPLSTADQALTIPGLG